MDRIEYISVRQLEIAVRIWHPDASNTVIAWHGLARHGGDFESLARKLGPQWRVIAPDTPGRGLSSWSLYPANDYLWLCWYLLLVCAYRCAKPRLLCWLRGFKQPPPCQVIG